MFLWRLHLVRKNNDYYLIRNLVKYDYDIFLEFLSHNFKVALFILGSELSTFLFLDLDLNTGSRTLGLADN